MTKSKKHYALLRQWKMLQLLPSRTPVDAATLREQLENEGFIVDLRTVQRDLKELMEVFPLTAKPGKPISWRWDRNAMSFDLPGMDRTGALTLKMVGEFMGRLLPKTCLESLAPNLRRADAILDDLGDKSFGGWPDKVRVVPRTQPLLSPEVDAEILEDVYESLFKDRRFKAQYLKKGAAKSVEYLVNPLGIVVSDPVLYLVATLRDYNDILLLAVHRIQSVEITDEPCRKPEGFTLDAYLKSGALGFPMEGEGTINLKVLFSKAAAAHLYESPLSADQMLADQKDGYVLVEAEVQDTHQLRWWLLSFGDQVEVVGPVGLREEMANTLRKAINSYCDGDNC
jgi:predicted DNA-binding transcriptional regulator YafY